MYVLPPPVTIPYSDAAPDRTSVHSADWASAGDMQAAGSTSAAARMVSSSLP